MHDTVCPVTVWRVVSCRRHVSRCRRFRQASRRSRPRVLVSTTQRLLNSSTSMPVCRQATGMTAWLVFDDYRSLSTITPELFPHKSPRFVWSLSNVVACLWRTVIPISMTSPLQLVLVLRTQASFTKRILQQILKVAATGQNELDQILLAQLRSGHCQKLAEYRIIIDLHQVLPVEKITWHRTPVIFSLINGD